MQAVRADEAEHEAADSVSEAELAAALRRVPGGALLLCGLGVSTLLLAWLAVYVFLFVARGAVA
ncbi:hypothetical protein [Lichenicoccus sp.]|uniref:hypothetical protein n=1 Tax=Lichenicoccus sp. TaxID=2781899 RepID=UPI003D151237